MVMQMSQPSLSIEQQLVLDQELYIQELAAENTQLRSALMDAQECADELRAMLDQVRDRMREYEEREQWTTALFANGTMSSSCKLVLWYFYLTASRMRAQPTGEELPIGVEEAASKLGVSTDTIRSATNKSEVFGILKRRYENYETDEQEKRTRVHLTLDDEMRHPQDIRFEKKQGGERVKGCHVDGTPFDNYTVRHCPTHGEVHIYGQLGLRKEANELEMVDDMIRAYRNRVPKALSTQRQKQDAFEMTQKQDAFDSQPFDQVDEKQDAFETQQPEKQDAFETEDSNFNLDLLDELDQALEKQDAFEREDSSMVRNVTVCRAIIELNKNGREAHGLEKVMSTRECGSTDWQWSEDDHCQICKHCWTPKPSTEKQDAFATQPQKQDAFGSQSKKQDAFEQMVLTGHARK